MLLEEAIKHCEEKALCGDACGLEHRQLAYWLRELMQLRYNLAKADAVIAEKNKEISELEERIADGDKDFEIADHQNERLLKIVRHQKYKRCLAMRNMCRYAQYSYSYLMEYEGCKICTNNIDFRKYDKKYHFYLRWCKRWMELAKKFKDKEA